MDTRVGSPLLNRLHRLETAVGDLQQRLQEIEAALAAADMALPASPSAPAVTPPPSGQRRPLATTQTLSSSAPVETDPWRATAAPDESALPADEEASALTEPLRDASIAEHSVLPGGSWSGPTFHWDVLGSSEFWLNKVGIGLLLFGVAFLFKYAVDQGWLVPEVRVALGLAIGLALLLIGLRLYEDRPHFSQVLLGGSIACFYITGFAAFTLFQLPVAPYPVAFGFMVGVTVLAFGLAARQNALVLSLIGTVGGLATPFVLYTGASAVTALVVYTCLVTAGAGAVYFYRGWHALLWTSFAGFWAVLIVGAGAFFLNALPIPAADQWGLLGGCAFGWLAFGAVPVVRDVLWSRDPARWQHPSLDLLARALARSPQDRLDPHVHIVTLITPGFALALAGLIAPWDKATWGVVVLAGFVVYAAAYERLRRVPSGLAYTHALMASLLLTLALVLMLDGDALFFALAAEATVLHFVASRLRIGPVAVAAHLLAAAVGWALALRLGENLANRGLDFGGARLTDLAVIGCAFAVSTVLPLSGSGWLYRLLAYLAGFGWLWVELGNLPDNAPAGYALLAWTAYATLLLVIAGRSTDRGQADLSLDCARVAGHLGFLGVGGLLAYRLLLGHALVISWTAGVTTVAQPGGLAIFNSLGLTDLAIIAVLVVVAARFVTGPARLLYVMAIHQVILTWLWRELSVLPHGGDYVILAWVIYAAALLFAVYRRQEPGAALSPLERVIALGADTTFLSLFGLLVLRIATGQEGEWALFNLKALVDLAAIGLALAVTAIARPETRYYRLAVYLALLGWLGREFAALPDGAGYVTAAWGLYGVVLFLIGLRRSQKPFLYAGIATLLLVVGKLFLVDLSMVDEIWRIALFLGFGGLFLVLSYYVQSWLRRRAALAETAA